MLNNRRQFIKKMLLTSLTMSSLAFSKISLGKWIAYDFGYRPIDKSLSELFPDKTLQKTYKINLKLPKRAENGNVVPITITSSIENIDTVYILSEKNPVPLIAKFTLDPSLETYIGARFKMKETCDVIVVAKAGDDYYQIRKRVIVTLGGCGG